MTLERGACQVCNREPLAVRAPAGGDGSYVVPVRHKPRPGAAEWCTGDHVEAREVS